MVVGRPFFALSLAWGLAVASASAAEDILIQEGIDSSPYSFLPSLPRGLRDTQYIFSGVDEGGFTHDFRTYVRFDLPPDLLGPDETVLEAYAWVYYSFDFTGFGESNEVPGEMHCHEVLEPWDELGVTWGNQPAFGPAFDVQPDIVGLSLLWCDVTDLVLDWATGASPNYGIALTNPTERLIGLYSFEAGQVDPNFRPSLVVSTGPSDEPDFDADGIPDDVDNCPDDPNADQADRNSDGVGNACSFAIADVDGNGVVNAQDRMAFNDTLGSVTGDPAYDPRLDLDADGDIDLQDELAYVTIFNEHSGTPSCGLIGLEAFAVLGLVQATRRRTGAGTDAETTR